MTPKNPLYILLKNEWRLTWRSKEPLVAVFFFVLIMVVLFQIGFLKTTVYAHPEITTLLWLATLFGGMLKLTRSHDAEHEGGVMSQLRLINNISAPYFLAKFVANLGFMIILQALAFLLLAFLMNLQSGLGYFSHVMIPMGLGLIGFSIIGTLFSAMTLATGTKDIILPVISYPILMPLIIGVFQVFEYSPSGELIGLHWAWVIILVFFDVLVGLLALYVFDDLFEAP